MQMSPNCLDEWRLIVAELNASVEVGCNTEAGATAAWATCRQGDVTRSSFPRLLAGGYIVEAHRLSGAAVMGEWRGAGRRRKRDE
jgi:hypothetical protein